MKSLSERTSKTVGNILQVTKNTIQLNENYYDYYINKDNALYKKQLPLLIQKANMQAIAIKMKEDEKNYVLSEQNQNKSDSLDKILVPLENIRNAQIRSKKLPPLCPFYSNKGELLRSVVTTSKILNKQYLTDDFRKSPLKKIKKIKLNNDLKGESSPRSYPVNFNFDDFQNDYFYEEEYKSLQYIDSEIFGRKDYYFEMIKNKINEFKTNEISDTEFKKEKIFEKNKQRKKVSLSFNSISVKIYEIKNEPKENEIENENIKNKDIPIFEYNLPFAYLPLFYYKGEEKFKIFLSKIIQWDNINNKFVLNENPDKIFFDILKNCEDFKEEKKEEKKKEEEIPEEPIKPSKAKFSLTMGGKKYGKKDFGFKFNALATTSIEEKNLAQTMVSPNPYLTNLDDSKKKYDIVFETSIYPYKKEYNYINFNVFEFLWLTPKKNFKVCITTPLSYINIPRNNIKVKKYIDFELLFYLYEKNFENWDFYLVKYLSSFKSFRTLLEEINSVNETTNKDFYLTQPRIKNYLFNNIKMINIATIKQKDILDNLIEGLMGIPEENKDEDEKNKKDKKEKKEEEKKDSKENKIEDKNEKENKENENKENEDKKEENNNTEENKKGEIKEDKKDEQNQIEGDEGNIIKSEEDLINSTFVEKCFIAIIRFVDTKTFKANEYKIYFNFSQFQKFQKMEKYIDKISFLIKFININYIKKSVNIDYKSIDNFDEDEWIKDFNQYNTQYLKTLNNNSINMMDYHRTNAEYLGMTRNSVIQIEIYTPISIARTLNEAGSIKTEKIFMNNDYQDKIVSVEKDNILELSKIFYDCYEEEQNKKS